MANIKIGSRDFIWSYIGNFFRVGTNIILLPFILKYLSNEDLGMWYVFAAIGQLVVLLDFGFAATLARNVAYVWCGAKSLQKSQISKLNSQQIDWHTFYVILKSCKCIYGIIALIAFVFLISFGSWYVLKIGQRENLIICWLIFSLGISLNLLYSYYTSILRGIGAIAENNQAQIISKSCQIVISIVLIMMGYGLLAISIGFFTSAVILRICSNYMFYRYEHIGSKLKQIFIKTSWNEVKKMFNTIWYNASRDGLVTLSNYLSTQANTLICSFALGLTSTGSYGLAVQLATMICTVAAIPFSTYLPRLQEYAITDDIQNSQKTMSRAIGTYISSYLLISALVVLCLPLVYWIRPDFSLSIGMSVAVLAYMFVYKFYNLFASYLSTYNSLPYAKSFIVSSILSVGLSFLLAVYTDLGIWSLIIGSSIVMLSYNAWKWPLVGISKLQMSISLFCKLSINNLNICPSKRK